MPTGTVKWFNGEKGRGSIQPDDGGRGVFVYISAVEQAGIRTLNEGQKISYELEAGDRGRRRLSACSGRDWQIASLPIAWAGGLTSDRVADQPSGAN
jgi:CspA family cold shock protein